MILSEELIRLILFIFGILPFIALLIFAILIIGYSKFDDLTRIRLSLIALIFITIFLIAVIVLSIPLHPPLKQYLVYGFLPLSACIVGITVLYKKYLEIKRYKNITDKR